MTSNLEIIFGNQAKAEIEKELWPCKYLCPENGACGAKKVCDLFLEEVRPEWTEKEYIEFCTHGQVKEETVVQTTKKEESVSTHKGAVDGSAPTKSQIIRCPLCNSSNIYLGIAEIDGVPILCYQCEKTSFVKERV